MVFTHTRVSIERHVKLTHFSTGTLRVSANATQNIKLVGQVLSICTLDPNTHDGMHVAEEDDFVASAVVYPSSTEEVQTIVRWANEHRIPISPISIGRNCTFLAISKLFTGMGWQTDRTILKTATEEQPLESGVQS